jgi:hypothetical protein
VHVDVDVHAIRPSLLLTDPVPLPGLAFTVRVNFCVKVAVPALTVEAGMVKEQELAPEQVPPLQPVKTKPEAGVAVRVTAAPELKLPEQLAPAQLSPAGLLDTEPEPASATDTPKAAVSKLALTNCTEFIATVHVPLVLVQAPLQPVNTDPAVALALKITDVPWL